MASERPSRDPVQVLLVDDDPVFREMGTGALGRRPALSVEAVSTPREALCVLGARPVDAVVSDVDLPGTESDGVELYRAVQGRRPALPFVFFTGTAAPRLRDRVDLRGAPATGYLRKGPLPGRYDALSARIERLLDRDREAGPGGTSDALAIERFYR